MVEADLGPEPINVHGLALDRWRDLSAEQCKVAMAKETEGIPHKDGANKAKKKEAQFWEDQVRTIDQSFLTKKHRSEEDEVNDLMNRIVKGFTDAATAIERRHL